MLSGLAISFLAWFGLFHANPRRSAYSMLSKSKQRARLTRLVSSALFILALWPCVMALGLERGIALWLGVIVCAGTIFMFTLHITPKTNTYLSIISFAVVPIAAVLAMMSGAGS